MPPPSAPGLAALPGLPPPSPADAYAASGRTLLVAAMAAAAGGRRVLDVGCKGGYVLQHLAEHARPDLLIGVDRDTTQLPEVSGDSYRILGGDVLRLPLADQQFDLVTFFDVIEHLPTGSEPQALTELARVLAPGGLLLLSTPADWRLATLLDPLRYLQGHRHYPQHRLLELAAGAGFVAELAETRGDWADVLGLPLFYVTARLGVPMPGSHWFAQRTNQQHSRSGRYTHFLALRKPA